MGMSLTLTASDGHKLGAYGADPDGRPKGGIVVIQEIFGVNHHIRSVVDRLAGEGYAALAPALFDRVQPDFQSGYSPDEVARARRFVAHPDWDAMLRDTAAAIGELEDAGPLAIMGFCMGGTVSFLSACRLDGLKAAICYYGGGIGRFADETPTCPTQMHFGRKDAHIPMTTVDEIKTKRPEAEIYVYDEAGHGFHCDERDSYHAESARLAWARSMEFLAKTLK
jgi:carboxymethylenebutenolidase